MIFHNRAWVSGLILLDCFGNVGSTLGSIRVALLNGTELFGIARWGLLFRISLEADETETH